MRCSRFGAVVLALVLLAAFGLAGCKGGGSGGTTGSGPESGDLPEAFTAAEGAKELAITAEGGGVGLSTGDAYAAVSVPTGAAEAGATWKVTPLAEAPAGVEKPLCPGIWVDVAGSEPTTWCAIGFSLPGTASPDATIVKLADDGTVAEVIPTDRMDYGGRTFLTAYVDSFSPYTTAEEDQAARDQAFQDRAKRWGKEVDWTIKVIGSETKEVEGWTFTYELDMFASGGGVGMGGIYKGHALLSMTGKYEGPASIVQSFGDVSGGVRDQALTFYMIDGALADLLTGQTVEVGMPCAQGSIKGEGYGNLNIYATAPTVSGEYHSGPTSSSEPMPFDLKVTTGEDVQVEIKDIGIFPGKILRTTR
jgi:hypothetical protein